MNWPITLTLAVALIVTAFIRMRVEARRARLVNWLFIYPGGGALLYYAWFRNLWWEVAVAVLVAAVVVGVWWIAYGSYLPAATSDSISVWGQESKKPAQAAAEAQAEVERLKKEKAELERELERLKKESAGEGHSNG